MIIRRFEQADSQGVADLVAYTLIKSNSKDYPQDYINKNITEHNADVISDRAKSSHMYVVDDNGIIGCGAIAGYWGSETESILLTIFVHPDRQGEGIGRRIIETLESDEFFARASRIEIPASITGCNFYRHMGYEYINNITTPDDEGCIRLEKRK